MMYGHVETVAERVEHLRRIREVQDETPGFRAFICWTLPARQHARSASRSRETPTSFDYLLTQAVSRIYLDNVAHIQSSWVTQGLKIGQVALHFGADDLGSMMLEENVVSAAGTTFRADASRTSAASIRAAGQRARAARHPLPRASVTTSDPDPVVAEAGYLLFIWTPTGYRLEEREGQPPVIGTLVELGELGRQEVQKVGSSPLPGDSRPCAFLTAVP